jgi:hypothetical protein
LHHILNPVSSLHCEICLHTLSSVFSQGDMQAVSGSANKQTNCLCIIVSVPMVVLCPLFPTPHRCYSYKGIVSEF